MVCRRQQGVIGRAQLIDLGFDDDEVRRFVDRGALRRLHHGVYADTRAPLGQRAHLLAAQLALGDGAFFSCRTAAALLGLRAVDLRAVELTLVADHTPRRAGLIVRRTTIPPTGDELRTTHDGLRHSSFARVLIELAGREPPWELERLIAEGARRRLLQTDRIDAALRRRGRIAGSAKLDAALAAYRPPDHEDASGLERAFAAWLATHPELPSPRRSVDIGPWEVDFYWPGHRLVVETDGEQYHRTPFELERDRRKDTWLQRHGIWVMRVTEHRFAHERAGILSDLRAFLARPRAA